MKTEQIIKILQLKGLGRVKAFKFAELVDKNRVETEKELIELLIECSSKKLIPRFSNYTKTDIELAFVIAEEIIEKSEKENIKILSYFDEDFPGTLRLIDNPPIILNLKGNYKSLNKLIGIAVIGTREPTAEGYNVGLKCGQKFGELNFNVVSGLANGCDTSAHTGCLNGNGFTTAILAGGLNSFSSKKSKELAEQISGNGVLMSEYFYGTETSSKLFVERDRLQAGLAKATVVIQTAINGGTMHAVNETIHEHKLLGAIQYNENLNSDKIDGNNELIKSGQAFALKSENIDKFISMIN